VLAAARRLGYRRNDAAHALRRADGRSASIGLVLEDIGNPFASALNRAVEMVASAQGSSCWRSAPIADPDREEQLIYRLLARAVDALVIMSCRRDTVSCSPNWTADCPWCSWTGPPADRASTSGWPTAGGPRRHRHLIMHGHHRIAFLGDRPSLYTADERSRGTCARCGSRMAADPAIQWRGEADSEHGAQALSAMLDLPDPPTAGSPGTT